MTTKKISASKNSRRGTKHRSHRMHPNSINNLIPYPPGVNGNPKPGNSLKAVLLNALGQPLEKPREDAPVRDHIVYATLKGAIACEPTSAHLKEVWDRAEGRVPEQRTEDGGVEVRVLNFVFILPDGTKVIPRELLTEGRGELEDA